jgi:DNA polymerase III epsilon subunit family exonuclease
MFHSLHAAAFDDELLNAEVEDMEDSSTLDELPQHPKRKPRKDKDWKPISQQVDLAEDKSTAFTPRAILDAESIVVLDTETTGLDHKTEGLLEIGAVRVVHGEITETFTTLIKPEQPIRHSSFKIHGISDEMVADAPSLEKAIIALDAFIGDSPYVAHNVVFDYSFITEAYKKHLNKRFLNPRICSQELYMALFPEEPSHGLSSLARKFGMESHVEHRALDDAIQLAKVYPQLRKLYLQKHAWKFSQLGNMEYLLERYLRLQKAQQTIQSEMADLKDVFKLYFTEGGHPIKATTGEILTASLKRTYDYNLDALMDSIVRHDLLKDVSRLNLRLVDRLIGQPLEKSSLPDDVRQELIATRKAISQNWTIELKRAGGK